MNRTLRINILIYFFCTLFFLLSVDTVYGSSQYKTYLLALKIECSANKGGGKPWKSNFWGIATDHTFHASRWWYGDGDRYGDC